MRDNLVAKLDAYLAESEGKELDYVNFDCCRFVFGWVAIATGINHMAGLNWENLKEGEAVLAAHGAKDLPGFVSVFLKPVPVTYAMLGDVVAMRAPGVSPWSPLGICSGVDSSFLFVKKSLVRARTIKAAYAWRISV